MTRKEKAEKIIEDRDVRAVVVLLETIDELGKAYADLSSVATDAQLRKAKRKGKKRSGAV